MLSLTVRNNLPSVIYSPSSTNSPTNHDSIFLDAPKYLRDRYQVTNAAFIDRARSFIESSSPVILPQPAPVRFQKHSVGMACCPETASHSVARVAVSTFAFCGKHFTVVANTDGVSMLGAFGSALKLEQTLVHEWTHAAQHRTYPNYSSQFEALLQSQVEVAERYKAKVTELSTMPLKDRMREGHHIADLLAEMIATAKKGSCFRIVHEGHAHYVENLYAKTEAERDQSKTKPLGYPSAPFAMSTLVGYLYRTESSLSYYLPYNKPYRAGAALFRCIDELGGLSRRAAESDAVPRTQPAFDKLFEDPSIVKKFLPYYDTWFTWHSSSYVDRQQVKAFLQDTAGV